MDELIIYRRQSQNGPESISQIEKSNRVLKNIEIIENGILEENHSNIHVDFANKQLGGGVLYFGCV